MAQLSWRAIISICYVPFPQLAGGGMVIEDLSLSLSLTPPPPTLCGQSHVNLNRSEAAHPPKASLTLKILG